MSEHLSEWGMEGRRLGLVEVRGMKVYINKEPKGQRLGSVEVLGAEVTLV